MQLPKEVKQLPVVGRSWSLNGVHECSEKVRLDDQSGFEQREKTVECVDICISDVLSHLK